MVWWPLSSTTDSIEVLSEPQFLGETGPRTIFTIEVKSARNIQRYSAIKNENELLLLPGTAFKVKSVLLQGELTMVQMEEDTSAPTLIDSGKDDYQVMSPESFYDLLGDAKISSEYATIAEDDDSIYALGGDGVADEDICSDADSDVDYESYDNAAVPSMVPMEHASLMAAPTLKVEGAGGGYMSYSSSDKEDWQVILAGTLKKKARGKR